MRLNLQRLRAPSAKQHDALAAVRHQHQGFLTALGLSLEIFIVLHSAIVPVIDKLDMARSIVDRYSSQNTEKEPMTAENNTRLIWIDLEMTGLDTINDTILEIATVVTDGDLNMLATGPVCAIRHDQDVLKAMDDWNRRHHTDSGLWQRVVFSRYSMAAAESETIAFSERVGRTGCITDVRQQHLPGPQVFAPPDAGTGKLVSLPQPGCQHPQGAGQQWLPEELQDYEKENRHEALSDIQESIEELQYYRQFMGKFASRSK